MKKNITLFNTLASSLNVANFSFSLGVAKPSTLRCSLFDPVYLDKRSFSSYGGKESGLYFKDDVLSLVLPSISNRDTYLKELNSILTDLSLDNSYVYKLEYSLFLHTNDSDKKVKFIVTPDRERGWEKRSLSEIMREGLGMVILYKNFEYRGYYIYYSDVLNLSLFNVISEHIKIVYKTLGKCVVDTNENLYVDEFIDFKKPSLLNIIRVKNGSMSGKKTSKHRSPWPIYNKDINCKSTLLLNNVFNVKKSVYDYVPTHNKHFHTNVTTNVNNEIIVNKDEITPQSVPVNSPLEEKKTFTNESLLINTSSASYNAINDIIIDPNLTLFEKQLKIEKSVRDFWKIEFYNIISNKRSLGTDSVGMQVVTRQIKLLDDDFKELFNKHYFNKKKYTKTIKDINPSLIVSIVMGKVIPFALKYKELDNQPVTQLIMEIAKKILNGLALEKYIEGLKEKVIDDSITLKEYMEVNNLKMNEEDLGNMGLDFVQYFCSRSNFVELKEVLIKKDLFRRYIIPKDDLIKFFNNFTFIDSDEIPMLIKPLPWKINDEGKISAYGGTLSNKKFQFKSLISNTYKNPLAKETILKDDYINTINKLSSTAYKINRDVFEIITKKEYFTNKNKRLVIFKPHEESGLLSSYIKNGEYIKINEIVPYNSKYLYDTSILNIARLMLNVDKFYLTVFADWRGRMYSSNSVLNMQGGELARGLIMFSKGEKLNEIGLRALKVYTANAFGLDKKSKNDRVRWVNTHFNDIINIPNNELWLSAEEPILFLACCLELQKYNKDPNFISRLPILLDATCNGLQHLSGIAHDINLAERVNISPSSDNDEPNDIYSDLIEPIRESIKELVKHHPERSNLLKLEIKRKLIKRGIMTITYGVTINGIIEQLRSEHFYKFALINNQYLYRSREEGYGDVTLNYKDLHALSNIIYNTLFKSHPTLNNIMQYFQKMAELMNDLKLPIQWATPYGLIIKQKYCRFTTYDITSVIQGKRKKITLKKIALTPKGEEWIDRRKQKNSFIPNFIHSMDASNIVMLITTINNKFDFSVVTIHDCFGVHANNVELLSYLVKQSFISIYGKKDSIDKFHSHMLENINAVYTINENKVRVEKEVVWSIPEKPNLGEMDLELQLKNSKYFIN